MSQKYEKLKTLLKELFQLDQPDLDFGLYRVMHAKSGEITQFLDKDLLPQVKQAFGAYQSADRHGIEQELAKVVAGIEAAGLNPNDSPKVKELHAKLANESVDIGKLESEVYDHLHSFFRRYYSEGDFLAKRVYKPGVYAIPYEGEEVTLHWANKDQYYIKTSEHLRDYAFRLQPDNEQNPMRVHFRLVDAAEGEHGNVKAAEGKERLFILAPGGDSGHDFISEEQGPEGKELVIRFEYRPATLNDWPSDANGDKKNPPKQKELLSLASARLSTVHAKTLQPWLQALKKKHTLASGETADYSRLEAHLRRYSARNTFDYFIHKDLGGFLRRELDFYIKNEIMHLDDVENESAPRVEQYLSKIKVLRRIASKVIAFLSQLEDFQKKIWLKKKFVISTNYCFTMNQIPEAFYNEIANNKAQLDEWTALLHIDRKMLANLARISSNALVDFFKQNPHLTVDTKHFPEPFKVQLLNVLDSIDNRLNGLLLHGDNFHGLKTIQARFKDSIKSVYLDPPYNTNVSAIPYKNSYRHSSWASMMQDRMALIQNLMTDASACYVSIDKNERRSLEAAMDYAFGEENKIEELIWSQNTNDGRSPTFSTNHEYVEVYSKNKTAAENDYALFREPKPGFEEVMQLVARLNPDFPSCTQIENELRKLYNDHLFAYRAKIENDGLDWETEKRNDPWNGVYQYKFAEYRDSTGKYVEESKARNSSATIWVYNESDWTIMESDRKQSSTTKDPGHPNYRYYQPLHPVTQKPCSMPSRGWKGTQFIDKENPERNSWESLTSDYRIAFGKDENKVPRQKKFLHEVDTNVAKSIVVDYSDGEKETSAIFGKKGVFLAPKHTNFVSRFILQSTSKGSVVLDIFGGSGSTAGAVINCNRVDHQERSFILMEANEYMDTIIIPRLKKTTYASSWKDGRPQSHDGISCSFKYCSLESYEDALNNLENNRMQQQQTLLDASEAQGPNGLKEQYMLGYMLDVETRGSQSLLNVQAFTDPTAYKLKVKRPGSDESREVNVDLLETFNWLLGLTVQHIAAPVSFKANFERDTEQRLVLKGSLKKEADAPWWFRTVTGTLPDGRKALVIWRKLPGAMEQDNLVLDEWFRKNTYSTQDAEFDVIYVNGGNNLPNVRRDGEHWKVRLIEEDFHRLMFDTETV